MDVNEKMAKRYTELETQMRGLRLSGSGGMTYYETTAWRQWATSAQHIIHLSFGERTSHFQSFAEAYQRCRGMEDEVDALRGIFLAAKADYEGGYTSSLQAAVSGEIYMDFVALAESALSEDSKDVAAVLACAALEDALKRFADMQGLSVSDKTMTGVVSALKSKGLIQGAQKTLLDTMPKIRNYAMHANWDKITAQDVGGVLGFVRTFLQANFS